MLALNRAYSLSNFTFTDRDASSPTCTAPTTGGSTSTSRSGRRGPAVATARAACWRTRCRTLNTVSGSGSLWTEYSAVAPAITLTASANARRLAQLSRWLPFNPALRNADNFEYYLENPN